MKVDPKYSTHLRSGIKTEFSLEEIKNLCDDLGIDFEDLGGEGKEGQARELIAFCLRRNRLADLVARCAELRPHYSWHDPNNPLPVAEPATPVAEQSPLSDSIVAVLDHDGNIAGTGFVIAGPLIVTCAHVVLRLMGSSVQVRCHKTKATYQTEIAVLGSTLPKAAGEKDVAILRPQASFLSDIPPLVLAPGLALTNTHFVTFGYPKNLGHVRGIHGEGVIRGRIEDTAAIPILQLTSQEVDRGMSGAPVVDKTGQRVIGMISDGLTTRDSAKLRDLVLAVPIEIVQEFLR